MNHLEIRKFFEISLFNSLDLGFRVKLFFFTVFVDVLHLGSEYNPDPGSQNIADPKHCYRGPGIYFLEK